MTEITAPWSEEGYADITAAARSGTDIEVEFANGDVVLLAASRFGLAGNFEVEPDAEEGLSVRIIRPSGQPAVLTWTQIRSAADPAFAHELRRRETEEARRIGLRLRALREDKNLNQRDVANLVGMSAPQLSKIESGTFDLRVSTVQSLLRAMGASLSDITGPDAPEISQKTVIKSAEAAGVPREVISGLLADAPRNVMARLIERAFGWRLDQLVAGQLPQPPILAGVAFKATRTGKVPGNAPLVSLSRTIAGIVRNAAVGSPAFRGLPSNPRTVNAEARDDCKSGHSGISCRLGLEQGRRSGADGWPGRVLRGCLGQLSATGHYPEGVPRTGGLLAVRYRPRTCPPGLGPRWSDRAHRCGFSSTSRGLRGFDGTSGERLRTRDSVAQSRRTAAGSAARGPRQPPSLQGGGRLRRRRSAGQSWTARHGRGVRAHRSGPRQRSLGVGHQFGPARWHRSRAGSERRPPVPFTRKSRPQSM